MNYLIVCNKCKAYAWVSGSLQDWETGDIELKDDNPEWKFKDTEGKSDLYEGDCQHEDYDIEDSEYEEPLMDDVI